jgi:hypothetical protein
MENELCLIEKMIADELCFGGGNELCLRNGKIL